MRSRRQWWKRVAKPETLWLLGCGNMAGAMLARWLDSGMNAAHVTVIDPALPDVGVRTLAALPAEAPPAMLLLGVKPQMLGDVASALSNAIGPDTMLLSILAGTTHASLGTLFKNAGAIVRVMPNLPVRIGKGAVALHAPGVARGPLDALFAPLGLIEWLDDEALFDAVTALSGSGPAFVYRFAQALAKGGVAMGLDPAQADRLARATVEGAAILAATSGEPLGTLADRVASKGGSTRDGLDVLDAEQALLTLVAAALRASEARNRALAQP
jgi:pyrroline-5-carboxylate reductase